MKSLALALILTVTAFVAIAAAAPPPDAHGARACSSKGLRFTRHSHGIVQSEKVTKLHATGVTCRRARQVATTVALRLLHNRKVPAEIGRFQLVVKRPCAGCAPDTLVTAKRGKQRISFHALGGA